LIFWPLTLKLSDVGRSVLIVDDEPYILRILSFKLRREGYITLSAESAEEAEQLIAERPVDLVLLDVSLATPTNGFDLAAKLRRNARTQHLPIIMLTARGFAADVLRGREVGAAGYITKPFSTEEVIRRVGALLGSPSS
jgi:two-component system phosphate regulon response regulator PhoB